jgi:hypothetical protein
LLSGEAFKPLLGPLVWRGCPGGNCPNFVHQLGRKIFHPPSSTVVVLLVGGKYT